MDIKEKSEFEVKITDYCPNRTARTVLGGVERITNARPGQTLPGHFQSHLQALNMAEAGRTSTEQVQEVPESLQGHLNVIQSDNEEVYNASSLEAAAVVGNRPAAGDDGQGLLPCQNSNNSIQQDSKTMLEMLEKHLRRITYGKKQSTSLSCNATKYIDGVGLSNVGFFTVTFEENLLWTDKGCWMEASKRLNSFITNFFPQVFGVDWIKVAEPQERGAIHYHFLVDCGRDIRTGVDFDEFKKRNYSSASDYLRSLWKQIREAAPKYGIGRCELLPLRTKSETVGNYVGKYIGKSIHNTALKAHGGRRLEYSRSFKNLRVFQNMEWSWSGIGNSKDGKSIVLSGAYQWRQTVKLLADAVGAESIDELSAKLGKSWAYNLQKAINRNVTDSYVAGLAEMFKPPVRKTAEEKEAMMYENRCRQFGVVEPVVKRELTVFERMFRECSFFCAEK